MHQTPSTARWYGYWATFISLHPGQLDAALDTPLNLAFARSRWYSAWSALIWFVAEMLIHRDAIEATVTTWTTEGWLNIAVVTILSLLAIVVSVLVGYGFLRLYTLISHVLTLNVLKGRGQRLRLLNVYTTILPLTVPFAMALILHDIGWLAGSYILFGVTIAYGLVLFVHGFHLVFHRTHRQALGLFISATLLTWFIIGIGALAIGVTLAVIGFFVAVVVRAFMHH